MSKSRNAREIALLNIGECRYLYRLRVSAAGQDRKQLIGAEEVKPGENHPFHFKVVLFRRTKRNAVQKIYLFMVRIVTTCVPTYTKATTVMV